MTRVLCLLVASLLVCFTTAAFAADAPAAVGQTKMGVIKSVDPKTNTFVVNFPARPLTIKVDDKTVITLDGKPSTFTAAIKPDLNASVTYTKIGEDRVASKVDVTSPQEK